MTRVKKIEEILGDLPKSPLTPINEIGFGPRDWLILSAGFEDRALGILKKAAISGSKAFSAIAVSYLPPVEQNRIEETRTLCGSMKVRLQEFVYDRQNPAGAGDKIVEMLGETDGTIYVDISGMSRLLIVQLLVALGIRTKGFANVHVLYSEAETYPPAYADVEKAINSETTQRNVGEVIMFLSSGVFDVEIVPELSSTAMQGQPIRLVAFPSFNPNQLTALRTVVQPSFFTIINGVTPSEAYRWRTEAINKLNDIENLPHREEVNASTLNYLDTLDCLLRTYKTYGGFQKLVVAPTGSKMQAVATAILRTFLDDVQIAYPTPQLFKSPDEYTLGIRQIYSLPLESYTAID